MTKTRKPPVQSTARWPGGGAGNSADAVGRRLGHRSLAGNLDRRLRAGGASKAAPADEGDDDHAFVVSQWTAPGTRRSKYQDWPGSTRPMIPPSFRSRVSSAGTAAAAGFYASALIKGRPVLQAFVVNQVHGVWSKPIEVQGPACGPSPSASPDPDQP